MLSVDKKIDELRKYEKKYGKIKVYLDHEREKWLVYKVGKYRIEGPQFDLVNDNCPIEKPILNLINPSRYVNFSPTLDQKLAAFKKVDDYEKSIEKAK